MAATPPYGADVDGVRALLPHATIYDEKPPPGRDGVTAGQVSAWLGELTGRVDLRLAGWRRLRADQTAVELAASEPAPQARLLATARTIVHNGAASYTEAARYPERARVADTSYAGVLWDRYVTGLTELAAWLTAELEEADASGDDSVVEPGPDVAIPLGNFPDAYVAWSAVRF